MWLDGSDEEQDMRDQPEVRGARRVDEWRCGARSKRNEEDKEVKERDRRCRTRKMRRMSGP